MKKKTVIILAAVLLTLCVFALIYRGCLSIPAPRLLFSSFDAGKISKFEIRNTAETLVFENINDRWQITKPISFEANEEYIKSFLDNIKGMSFKNVISTNKDKFAKFKVDDSSGLLVNVYAGKSKKPVSFYAGKSSALNTANIYFRLSGTNKVYVSRGPKNHTLIRKSADWRNRVILKLTKEDIAEINLTYPAETVKLFHNKDKWLLGNPDTGEEVKQDVLDQITNKLGSFRANEIITPEEAEEIRDELGFDKPGFRFIVRTFGGEEHKFIVGNKKGDSNYYIKKERSDIVYTIGEYNLTPLKKKASDLKKEPAEEPLQDEPENKQ